MSENNKNPQHVAFIMDGNGRWAQKRFMPRTAGHIKGASIVKSLVKSCIEAGIQYVTLFAFSTENWKRPQDEVSTLMNLFIQYLKKEVSNMQKEGIRLNVIGDTSKFPQELQASIRDAMATTADGKGLTLSIAANYGGRWDIMHAVQAWQQAHPELSVAEMTEADVSAHLSTAGIPEPDLLIRTGGESRISNFMLWQLAYAECYFTQTLWPDFDEAEFDKALAWFGSVERRFGSVLA